MKITPPLSGYSQTGFNLGGWRLRGEYQTTITRDASI
jgi:outer membrane usher protein FimD/PapC